MSKSEQKRLNIQRGMAMTIREEFLKDFKSEFFKNGYQVRNPHTPYEFGVFGAVWMAERCANLIDSYNAPDDLPSSGGNKIRQLAKELQ